MSSSKVWMAAEVYPVWLCIGGGVGLAAWFGTRQLRKHNDIVINKNHPRQYMDTTYPKMVENGYKTHMKQHHAVADELKKKD